jgi:two-component system response regulator AtoC
MSNASHDVSKYGGNDVLTEPVAEQRLCPAIASADALSAGGWTRKLEAFIQSVGPAEMPVLILGETGVGKDVLARRLHAASRRAAKPLLKINCAAMPPELVESELFGYERGAFTGALQRKPGMFELANGGTLLLDEIGDMDARLQAKLLQVLQDRTFQRLGGRETVSVDVRVLSATHRNLQNGIIDGTFREDLYYRLNVISIKIPPLRERRDEILSLAARFLDEYAEPGQEKPTITPELEHALLQHDWRGNVRELSNMMRRFLVFGDADAVLRHITVNVSAASASAATASAHPERPSLIPATPHARAGSVFERTLREKQQAEAEAILATLNATRWNRVKTAEQLGLGYKALLYRMRKLGISGQSGAADSGVADSGAVDSAAADSGAPALLRRSG